MVIKRLSCVFRLSDGCMSRLLTGSEASFLVDGIARRHEFKPGGYFVLTDLTEGDHEIEITAAGYQPEHISLNVDYGVDGVHVRNIALNPSDCHPAAGRYPAVCGIAPGVESLALVRPVGHMRVAEERSEKGAVEIRMFSEGKTPAMPLEFLLGKGATAEFVTFTGGSGGVYQTAFPMKHSHSRSETAQPLIRLNCSADGGFYLLLPGMFCPDISTGMITLRFAALKKGKPVYSTVSIPSAGKNDVGTLKFKEEK